VLIDLEFATIRFIIILFVWIGISEFIILPNNNPVHAQATHAKQVTKPANVIFASGKTLACEIADTNLTRMIGLSNYKPQANVCMLFIFDEPHIAYFWMPSSMQFPIDMIFITADGYITNITHGAQPCQATRIQGCEQYPSHAPIKYVIEVNAGAAKQYGLHAQQRIIIQR